MSPSGGAAWDLARGLTHLRAGLDLLTVGVEHHREAEKEAARELHVVDDAHVGLLIHESRQGREAAVGDQFDIAELTRGELERDHTHRNEPWRIERSPSGEMGE